MSLFGSTTSEDPQDKALLHLLHFFLEPKPLRPDAVEVLKRRIPEGKLRAMYSLYLVMLALTKPLSAAATEQATAMMLSVIQNADLGEQREAVLDIARELGLTARQLEKLLRKVRDFWLPFIEDLVVGND